MCVRQRSWFSLLVSQEQNKVTGGCRLCAECRFSLELLTCRTVLLFCLSGYWLSLVKLAAILYVPMLSIVPAAWSWELGERAVKNRQRQGERCFQFEGFWSWQAEGRWFRERSRNTIIGRKVGPSARERVRGEKVAYKLLIVIALPCLLLPLSYTNLLHLSVKLSWFWQIFHFTPLHSWFHHVLFFLHIACGNNELHQSTSVRSADWRCYRCYLSVLP